MTVVPDTLVLYWTLVADGAVPPKYDAESENSNWQTSAEMPGNLQLRGADSRASSLRCRVRVVKKSLRWLSAAREVPYSAHVSYLVEYLQMRLSEPYRGALKKANQAFFVLEEVVGVVEEASDFSAVWWERSKVVFKIPLCVRPNF